MLLLGFYILGKVFSWVWINGYELESNGIFGVDCDCEVVGLMDVVFYVLCEILVMGENMVVLEMFGYYSLIYLYVFMYMFGMV